MDAPQLNSLFTFYSLTVQQRAVVYITFIPAANMFRALPCARQSCRPCGCSERDKAPFKGAISTRKVFLTVSGKILNPQFLVVK